MEDSTSHFTSNDAPSQLAEHYPQVDLPQRIDAPEKMKVPLRIPAMARNQVIRNKYFSPHAHMERQNQLEGKRFYHADFHTKIRQGVAFKYFSEKHGQYHNQLKDLSMLAASSRRSNRYMTEGTCYFSSGIIYDNLEEYSKAIDNYKKFAHVCQKMNEPQLEALAYNCIAVDLMHCAAKSSNCPYEGHFQSPENALLLSALRFHEKHAAITDEAGKFVAHTNLGLTCGSLGQFTEAARHHQDALRIAIALQSTYGQSIAVGNLGLLASRQQDLVTARACMDQFLQLTQTLNDASAETRAWTELGLLSNREGHCDEAVQCFEKSCEVAEKIGETGISAQAACHMGIAKANAEMQDHMLCILETLEARK